MSRLNFASIDKAFELGSKNIIDTQEEIANLKKLLASTIPAKQQPPSDAKQPPTKEKNTTGYQRIGPPDQQFASFNPNAKVPVDTFDNDILRVIGHPRFNDVVSNYIAVKRPELANAPLQQTNYVPANSISYFGNQYNSTVCSDVKRYVSFYIICVILFLGLTMWFKEPKV